MPTPTARRLARGRMLGAGRSATRSSGRWPASGVGRSSWGRAPGHHALAARAMGFCLLGNIAVGAAHARAIGAERVAILDWGRPPRKRDAGHVLWRRHGPRLLGSSVRRLLPGLRRAPASGGSSGRGVHGQRPAPGGQGDAESSGPSPRCSGGGRTVPARLILVSAGFDALRGRPARRHADDGAGFGRLATVVRGWSDALCDGRVVACWRVGTTRPHSDDRWWRRSRRSTEPRILVPSSQGPG
jgi:hypothetical protein